MRDVNDPEHWRDFVRVDPVGPGGLKPHGQGKAALVTYMGDKHSDGRHVIGSELTRPQAENLCAAIMACFEEPEPSQEEFLHEPEEKAPELLYTPEGLRLMRIAEGVVERAGLEGEVSVAVAEYDGGRRFGVCLIMGETRSPALRFSRDCEEGFVEVHLAMELGKLVAGAPRDEPGEPDEPYWKKSFAVIPPPEGLEGGLAETAVVVQAKHGGPVPLTRGEAEEFIDEIQVAIQAGEDE